LNYRHAFHAGNFADIVKHAAVGLILERLTAAAGPLLVVDTHAGAGTYDLQGDMAQRSGEAQAGVVRLMADPETPAGLRPLKAAVNAANPDGTLRLYPGSPALIAAQLRPQDEYQGAELRPDDFALLSRTLAGARGVAKAVAGDGFDLAADAAADSRRLFVLIDPPFERADDYVRIVQTLAVLLRRKPPTSVLVWLPLKDLETFDSLLRRVEDLGAVRALVVEARLRPLTDPMRLNGCALVVLNDPPGLGEALRPVLDWVVQAAGEAGGQGKIWRLEA
jgi:23S rRNA (adenine2030-N6)-methyltransferase